MVKKSAITKILPFLLILIGLSACGFKLRGTTDIPRWLNNVAIITEDGNPEMIPILTSSLQAYNIRINPDPAQAAYWIVLAHTIHTQQITGVAASTAPRQFQLSYQVDFLLRTRQGDVLKPLGHVSSTRQLTVNNDRILGSDDEASIIFEEMRHDVAIQIINRLGTSRR